MSPMADEVEGPVVEQVSMKRPYPQGAMARQRVRDATLARALATAEQMHLERSLSLRCWDAIRFGREPEDHDCRNNGASCLCECHDLTVSS